MFCDILVIQSSKVPVEKPLDSLTGEMNQKNNQRYTHLTISQDGTSGLISFIRVLETVPERRGGRNRN